MESSTNSWFSESGLAGMDQYDFLDCIDNPTLLMDSMDDDLSDILGDDFIPNAFSPASTIINNVSSSTTSSFCPEPPQFAVAPPQVSLEPPQLQKVNPDHHTRASNSSPIILDFGKVAASLEKVHGQNSGWALNPFQEAAVSEILRTEDAKNGSQVTIKTAVGSRARPPSQTYDHIVSERKRRKLLSQQFLVLSGMVPGLKKLDKTSVLGETIKYLKNLQERVEILEERVMKQTVESVVLVKRSQVTVEDEGSSDESCDSSYEQLLPEIEAKLCNNQALLRIQCEKRNGIMTKILGEVDKLNLVVVHNNMAPFGNFALDITIIIEMNKDSTLEVQEIVRALYCALKNT